MSDDLQDTLTELRAQPDVSPSNTSRGPWHTHPPMSRCQAVLIVDADNEIIGWATDAAGHTTEDVAPDRRSRGRIEANAALMASAASMHQVVKALAAFGPKVAQQMGRAGIPVPPDMALAIVVAGIILDGERR